MALLQPLDPSPQNGPLCVVNTHLFFHKRAPHIRTIQAAILAAEAAAFADRAALDDADGRDPPPPHAVPAVVLCGDLNSSYTGSELPGCLELLRAGRLTEDFADWGEGASFALGPKGAPPSTKAVAPPVGGPVGARLQVPLCLRSADGFALPYTNFVEAYEVRVCRTTVQAGCVCCVCCVCMQHCSMSHDDPPLGRGC